MLDLPASNAGAEPVEDGLRDHAGFDEHVDVLEELEGAVAERLGQRDAMEERVVGGWVEGLAEEGAEAGVDGGEAEEAEVGAGFGDEGGEVQDGGDGGDGGGCGRRFGGWKWAVAVEGVEEELGEVGERGSCGLEVSDEV